MSDYYSHRDQANPGHKPGYPDYAGSTSSGAWIWVAIVLVAIFALIGLGLSGGGTETDGATPLAAPEESAAPAATDAAPVVPAD